MESISIRETRIRQTDNQLVIMPDGIRFKHPLTTRTDQEQRRSAILCGVAYGEDVDEAREVIDSAVRRCESVITDERPVRIFAQESGGAPARASWRAK